MICVSDDHTRVVLHDFEVEHDDYINANYIDVSFSAMHALTKNREKKNDKQGKKS